MSEHSGPVSPYLLRPCRTLREACLDKALRTGECPPCETCAEDELCQCVQRNAHRLFKRHLRRTAKDG